MGSGEDCIGLMGIYDGDSRYAVAFFDVYCFWCGHLCESSCVTGILQSAYLSMRCQNFQRNYILGIIWWCYV